MSRGKGRRRRLSKVSNVNLRRRCSTCQNWALIPYESLKGRDPAHLPDDEVMCTECQAIFDTTNLGLGAVTPIHEEKETVLYIQWPKRLRRVIKGTEVVDEEIVLIPSVDSVKHVQGEMLGVIAVHDDIAFVGV